MTRLPKVVRGILADAGNPELTVIENKYEARSRVPGYDSATGAIWSPVKGDEELATVAHEAGHIVTSSQKETKLWRELKATLWAFNALERHQGEVKPEQFAWLKKALTSYRDNATDVRFQVLLGHEQHFDQAQALINAETINDPAVQALLKGTYGRAD